MSTGEGIHFFQEINIFDKLNYEYEIGNHNV